MTHLVSSFELIPVQVEQGWINGNMVSVIDTQQKQVIGTIGLDEPSLGAGNPWGVACTCDGKSIVVSHVGSQELSVIATAAALGPLVHVVTAPAVDNIPDDPAQAPGLRRIKLPGQGPRALAVAGSKIYVAEYFGDTLAVVGIEVSGSRGGSRTPVAIINVRQDNRLISLVYDLYEEPAISTPVTSDIFVSDTAQRQWLYDEVDVVDEPRCRHQILLNTGEVIDLWFIQFDWSIHHSPRHALVAQAAELARA